MAKLDVCIRNEEDIIGKGVMSSPDGIYMGEILEVAERYVRMNNGLIFSYAWHRFDVVEPE